MTTPVDLAPVQQLQAAAVPEAVGAAAPKSTPTARWVPGLLTACTVIALVVRGPPPSGILDENAYFLALSAAFFAGVAGVMAAFWVSDDPRGLRVAASKQLFYSSVAALAVTVGLSVASLIW